MEDTKDIEYFDEDLQRMFGDRYTDVTKETVKQKEVADDFDIDPDTLDRVLRAAEWHRLLNAVKWTGAFGALALLIFNWMQTSLMDPAVAIPSMCACTLLMGFGVGKNLKK